MNKSYKRPILALVFDIIGALALIVGVISVLAGFTESDNSLKSSAAFATGGISIIAAIFYIGIGQIIDFLGRTAHHTERMADFFESNMAPQFQRMEDRLVPGRSAPAAPKAEYFYSLDGNHEGPFSASELRSFRQEGMISEKTNIFRTGDKEWLPLRMFPDLMRN